LVTCILLLGALALAIPAVTLAGGGGGSAGDQQYTDPFAGTSPGKSKPKTTSTSAPTTSTQPATTPATGPTPTTSVTPVASTSTASDPTTPTATIASTTGQLPHTGYDSWLAAGLGFVLVAGGLGLRARLRRI
jgi:LPXTG-motif cell wall-anchored protein